jgi:hypothetical protein
MSSNQELTSGSQCVSVAHEKGRATAADDSNFQRIANARVDVRNSFRRYASQTGVPRGPNSWASSRAGRTEKLTECFRPLAKVYIQVEDRQVDDLQYVVMNRIRADVNDSLPTLTDPFMPFDLFSDPEFEAGLLAMIAAEIAPASPITPTPKDSRAPDWDGRPRPRLISCKPARRNPKDEKIDRILREIAESQPNNHEEVFEFLDSRRVPIPNAQPFKKAGRWFIGFQADRQLARVWLSKRWASLGLPAFRRGRK